MVDAADRAPIERVLVLVPTYDERENLPVIVERIRSAVPDADILVLDDNSPDGTGQLADEMAAADAHVHVMHRRGKEGLGKAYLAGFEWALAQGYDAGGMASLEEFLAVRTGYAGHFAPAMAVMARELGMPLRLVGPRSDPEWFDAQIRPQLGGAVEYLGHLGPPHLAEVVGTSAATLVTPQWDEPFGLIAAESAACGTPVAAALHLARTVARRAEREVIRLLQEEEAKLLI